MSLKFWSVQSWTIFPVNGVHLPEGGDEERAQRADVDEQERGDGRDEQQRGETSHLCRQKIAESLRRARRSDEPALACFNCCVDQRPT